MPISISLSPPLRALALITLFNALFTVACDGAHNAPAAVDLAAAFAEGRVSGSDAELSLETADGVSVLRAATGHVKQWPGANLAAPAAGWDFTPYATVEIALRNRSAARLELAARIDNKGADGKKNCVNGSVALGPDERGVLRIPLRRTHVDTLDGKLFGMRGFPVGVGPGWQSIDPAKITRITVFLTKPAADYVFDIESIRAPGRYELATPSTSDADPFIPFIDTFGQYRHRDWPGKVHSLDQLIARRGEEARELDAASAPADWNQFGGWKSGPQLEATGFFRTAKRDGKWWLVDPEGRLFFSIGMDAMRSGEATVVQEREHFFADFPGNDPEFAPFVMKNVVPLKGHYAGRKVRAFSFAGANLLRKYGPGWSEASNEIAQRRLRSWGLNTIGMWSDPQLREMRRTPYVDHFGSWGVRMIDASEGHWGKFPDPFDPGLRQSFRKRMEEKRESSAGDPWCIGYFSDNEMSWGDDTSLALATLQSPASQPAKAAFLADLQKKYGPIEKLNAAWGTAHASWDALRASTAAPDFEKARPDLTAFSTRIAEEYFRTAREAIKEVAPHQLYLGCRFWYGTSSASKPTALTSPNIQEAQLMKQWLLPGIGCSGKSERSCIEAMRARFATLQSTGSQNALRFLSCLILSCSWNSLRIPRGASHDRRETNQFFAGRLCSPQLPPITRSPKYLGSCGAARFPGARHCTTRCRQAADSAWKACGECTEVFRNLGCVVVRRESRLAIHCHKGYLKTLE